MDPRVGQIVAGRYLLEQQLGAGGMGSVWRVTTVAPPADAIDFPGEIALKLMLEELSPLPQIRARFEREARAMQEVYSPHVVRLLDYGVDDGTPFIAMELLQGEDLQARLKARGPFAPSALAPIAQQICRGLQAAHAAGVIHRDLKPGNLFMARQADGSEIVKIVDFGIAKVQRFAWEQEATRTNALLGSWHYMSPEQLKSPKDVGHQTDLWSTAVLLCRLLTGKYPFNAEEPDDLRDLIVSGAPRLPSAFARGLAGLDPFFTQAFQKDPRRRFHTAIELADTFVHACEGLDPITRERTCVLPEADDPATVVREPRAAEIRTDVRSVRVPPAPSAPGPRRSTLLVAAVGVVVAGGLGVLVTAAVMKTGSAAQGEPTDVERRSAAAEPSVQAAPLAPPAAPTASSSAAASSAPPAARPAQGPPGGAPLRPGAAPSASAQPSSSSARERKMY